MDGVPRSEKVVMSEIIRSKVASGQSPGVKRMFEGKRLINFSKAK